jgi:hypothetical protein
VALYSRSDLSAAPGRTAANSKLRTQIEGLGSADEPSYLYWVNPAEITSEVGNSLWQLGQVDQEVVVLNEVSAVRDFVARARDLVPA